MEVWLLVIGVVGGGLVSGLGTYVASRGKLRLDYDASLRSEQITAYTDLWGRLAPLAKYGPGDVEPFDYATAGTYLANGDTSLALSYPRRFPRGRRPSILESATSAVAVTAWEPSRSTLRIRRGGRERVLFVENGLVVEGPPAVGGDPAPATLWVRKPDA